MDGWEDKRLMKNSINIAYSPVKGWHEVKQPSQRKAPYEGGTNRHFVGTPKQTSETKFYSPKR